MQDEIVKAENLLWYDFINGMEYSRLYEAQRSKRGRGHSESEGDVTLSERS